MCDICKLTNSDKDFVNGDKKELKTVKLQRFASTLHKSTLRLCYIHDIEFFISGERRFVEKYYHITVQYRSAPVVDAIHTF